MITLFWAGGTPAPPGIQFQITLQEEEDSDGDIVYKKKSKSYVSERAKSDQATVQKKHGIGQDDYEKLAQAMGIQFKKGKTALVDRSDDEDDGKTLAQLGASSSGRQRPAPKRKAKDRTGGEQKTPPEKSEEDRAVEKAEGMIKLLNKEQQMQWPCCT